MNVAPRRLRYLCLAVPLWSSWGLWGLCSAAAAVDVQCVQSTCSLQQLASAISAADYRGDVPSLVAHAALAAEMATADPAAASDAMYWQAFALWRVALNSLDEGDSADSVAPQLDAAGRGFDAMVQQDPDHLEARIALLGVLVARLQLWPQPTPKTLRTLARANALAVELKALAPGNVRAAIPIAILTYHTPESAGGGQTQAISDARNVLALPPAVEPAGKAAPPTWGRPELLATLAFMLVDRNGPNAEAEQLARAALTLQPHWRHATRTLLPRVSKTS